MGSPKNRCVLEKKLCDLDKGEEKEEPVPAATTTESGTTILCTLQYNCMCTGYGGQHITHLWILFTALP